MKSRILILMAALLPGVAPHALPGQQTPNVAYDAVDPFIGTAKDGNTFPGATRPFGMIQWSPDTGDAGWYNYDAKAIHGFSLTHLSGAGCTVYGDVPILPWTGPVTENPAQHPQAYDLPFAHEDASGSKLEEAHPGYYSIRFPSGVRVDLTATQRTGIGRFSFPAGAAKTILFKVGGGPNAGDPQLAADRAKVEIVNPTTLVGSVQGGMFCGQPDKYVLYFVVKFQTPFASSGAWDDQTVTPNGVRSAGRRSGVYVTFGPDGFSSVQMKVGLSFVSAENAEANLQAENPGWDFEKTRLQAKEEWIRRLNRVEIEGGTSQQRTAFYTGLYHMMLSPTLFSDANGDYIGFDSKIRRLTNSAQYANFSDWDIYRSAIQLQAWLFPRETSDMMQSLVRDAEQMGWLPKWPVANDVTEVMGGDSPPIVLANAYAFGAQSFDAKSALAFSIKSATQSGEGPHGYYERRYGEEYRKLGYIASESSNGSASQTLEYANSDFAIAQFAKALGDSANAERFLEQSQNWKKLLDPAIGWTHTRSRDGKFTEGFDIAKILPKQNLPWDHVNQLGFEEGNTFQYTFMVPFDYSGLFQTIGGREESVKRLDSFFTELRAWGKPYFNVENEPDFVVPFAYDFAGVPWKTQKVMTRILAETFTVAPSGIPGNDDLGATSGVYVWGALGLYPAIPGVPGLAVGTPMFKRATLHFENGSTLEINRSGKGIYVHSLSLGGHPWDRSWIPLHGLSAKAAQLHFQMQETPDLGWASRPKDTPPSFGNHKAGD